MSYILDAIKKSDRERQRQLSSALVRPQAEFRAGRGSGRETAMWLMVGALALASGVGGALLAVSWRDDAIEPGDAVVAERVDAAQPAAAVVEPGPGATSAGASAAPASSAQDISAPALALMEIWQLTEAEQRYLGELEVSLHVHSTDPAQRTVIVNGLRAKEGQSLGQDIRLLEITPDGLIVEFQGKHVHLSTVRAS